MLEGIKYTPFINSLFAAFPPITVYIRRLELFLPVRNIDFQPFLFRSATTARVKLKPGQRGTKNLVA